MIPNPAVPVQSVENRNHKPFSRVGGEIITSAAVFPMRARDYPE
jgi:hypothetical protein